MDLINDIATLEALYETPPVPASLTKVQARLTPHYCRWIEASKFCVLTTVGPDGTDGSPRGDDGPVVRILDDTHLAMPDWKGNNRLDSLRNIVRDGRVSLMFMVPGANIVVRVNGTAELTTDAELLESFARDRAVPRSVIVIEISELYFQCAKALMRSRLWGGDAAPKGLPTAGDFIKEVDQEFDAESYDTGYAERAKPRMW